MRALVLGLILAVVLATPVAAKPSVRTCVPDYSTYDVTVEHIPPSQGELGLFGYLYPPGSTISAYNFGSNAYRIDKVWTSWFDIVDRPEWYGWTGELYFYPLSGPAYDTSLAIAECDFVVT